MLKSWILEHDSQGVHGHMRWAISTQDWSLTQWCNTAVECLRTYNCWSKIELICGTHHVAMQGSFPQAAKLCSICHDVYSVMCCLLHSLDAAGLCTTWHSVASLANSSVSRHLFVCLQTCSWKASTKGGIMLVHLLCRTAHSQSARLFMLAKS